ncbi:MAG: hypothetical protein ACREYE_06635 [Gammaproteobacteria bacterium]
MAHIQALLQRQHNIHNLEAAGDDQRSVVMRAWYDVFFGGLEDKSRRTDEQSVRESQINRSTP